MLGENEENYEKSVRISSLKDETVISCSSRQLCIVCEPCTKTPVQNNLTALDIEQIFYYSYLYLLRLLRKVFKKLFGFVHRL